MWSRFQDPSLAYWRISMGPMHHLPELSGLLSTALHYSTGTVLPVSPLHSFLPSQKPEAGGGKKARTRPWVSARSAATKLGYTVALLEIRKRSRQSFCLLKMLPQTSDSPSLLLSFYSSSFLQHSFTCFFFPSFFFIRSKKSLKLLG